MGDGIFPELPSILRSGGSAGGAFRPRAGTGSSNFGSGPPPPDPNPRLTPHPAGESGFTLPELLVVLAVSGILFSALTASFYSQARVYRAWQEVSQMQQTVRAAVDLITRELHMAGYDPLETGLTGLAHDSGRLRIVADFNRDGDADDANEDVIYQHSEETLRITRNTGGGAQPFAENIETFTFTYLDEHGAPTSTTAAIRAVRITVIGRTANSDPGYPTNGGHRTYSLTSTVTPANLGY